MSDPMLAPADVPPLTQEEIDEEIAAKRLAYQEGRGEPFESAEPPPYEPPPPDEPPPDPPPEGGA